MPPLKLGIVDQSPVPNGSDARTAVAATLDLARWADRAGFSRYWVAEHHSTNSFAGSAPEVLIPAVASVTERIRVGSGGVMLPHYSPYKVAEQFRMLQTLFPGRIDLGLGRAPAGTGRAAQALRYGRAPIAIEHFPQQLDDLAGWLGESLDASHPLAKVRATPRGKDVPELWMLASSGTTAAVAASRGLGYSFAQFISGVDGSAAVRAYQAAFQPGAHRSEPAANVGIGVLCADTTEEAEWLSLSLHLWRMRIMRGMDRGIPSPEQAKEEFEQAGIPIAEVLAEETRVVVGNPAEVRDALLALADRYGVDELMTVTVTHDLAARRRSYELLAEAMGVE
ncbi:LLM class flavin-dependent oxidoreductase [Gaopeijia maritima]|uniref:LLM class flavin-dependent oxidoreductase n=1 Tax=Gaopeijia maritima TaxID=3119007 RepID=A0ABU9E9V9_9BACT